MASMQQATLEKHGWAKQGNARNGVEHYMHPEHGSLFVDHYSLKWRHGANEGDTSYGTSPKHLATYVANLPKRSNKPMGQIESQLSGIRHSQQHSEEEVEQFAESYHNIESKKFPGHSHYVGYGDGVWHIHKYSTGDKTWKAVHQSGGSERHPTGYGATLKHISEHLSKFASQHEEEVEQFKEPIHLGNGWYFHRYKMDANGNHRVHVSKGANRGFSIQTNGVLPLNHRGLFGGPKEPNEEAKKELLHHLERTRGASQHSEQEEPEEEVLSTTLHGSPGSFAPAIFVKPQVKTETIQYAEQKMVEGRSKFLAQRSRGTVGGRGVHRIFHQILQKHGGAVHNAHGGFTLPKKAVESFNDAASQAGFQHGYHYSLNG